MVKLLSLDELRSKEMKMNQDLYNVYMVLCNGLDCWWQGYATDGGHALDLAWEYATMVKLMSLDELRSMGVEVTVCKPGKAKGVRKQACRAKGIGSFIRGGAKPIGYTKMAFGSS